MGYSPWGHRKSDMTEHTHMISQNFAIYQKSVFFSTVKGMFLSLIFGGYSGRIVD